MALSCLETSQEVPARGLCGVSVPSPPRRDWGLPPGNPPPTAAWRLAWQAVLATAQLVLSVSISEDPRPGRVEATARKLPLWTLARAFQSFRVGGRSRPCSFTLVRKRMGITKICSSKASVDPWVSAGRNRVEERVGQNHVRRDRKASAHRGGATVCVGSGGPGRALSPRDLLSFSCC